MILKRWASFLWKHLAPEQTLALTILQLQLLNLLSVHEKFDIQDKIFKVTFDPRWFTSFPNDAVWLDVKCLEQIWSECKLACEQHTYFRSLLLCSRVKCSKSRNTNSWNKETSNFPKFGNSLQNVLAIYQIWNTKMENDNLSLKAICMVFAYKVC